MNYEETKPFDKMDKLGEEIADNLHKQNKNTRSMFAKVNLDFKENYLFLKFRFTAT